MNKRTRRHSQWMVSGKKAKYLRLFLENWSSFGQNNFQANASKAGMDFLGRLEGLLHGIEVTEVRHGSMRGE